MPARAEIPRFVLLMLLVAFAGLSVDIAIPVLSAFAAAFQTSTANAQLTLSVFVFGFAAAQLAAGPLSDRFGRKPVLIGGCAIYVAASGACMLAETIEQLIAARFVQALGCCAGPVVGRAIVRDLFGAERAAKVLAYMAMVMGFVPGVAPIIGGFLAQAFDWRAVFAALLVFGSVALLGCIFILRETNRFKNPAAIHPRQLAGNYLSFLGERVYLSYALPTGLTYAAMLSFHSLSPFVLIDQFGVRTANYGYWFFAIVFGYVIGSFGTSRLHGRLRPVTIVTIGLCIELFAATAIAILGWARIDTPLAVVAPMVVFMIGAGFVFPNATAGAIGPYPTKAGAASALLGFLQFGTGAIIATIVTRFHDGTQKTMVTGILLCTLMALLSFRLLATKPKAMPAPAA